MKNKISKILVLLLTLTLLLSSCGSPEVDKSLTGEIICITKDVFNQPEGDELSTLQTIVNKFAEFYPKIKVTINLVTNEDDFIPQVLAALSSDTPPDVILATPDEMVQIMEGANKTFENIESLLTPPPVDEVASKDSETEKTPPVGVFSEKVLGLKNLQGQNPVYYPFAISANLMAFNKNILDAAGMSEKLPSNQGRTWTIDEYKAFMLELSEKLPLDVDTGIFYYGTKDGSLGSKSLVTNAYCATLKTDGNITINSEEGLNGLTALKELIDESAMINGFTVDMSNNINKFIKGETAHTIYYNLGYDLNYKKDKKDDFETIFVPYPSSGSPKLSYNAFGGSIVSSSDENKIELSKTFLNFIGNTKDFSGYIAGTAGMYSPVADYNDFLKDEYAYLNETLNFLDTYSFTESQNHEAQWILMLRKVLFLDEDPKEALDFFAENSEDFVFSQEEPKKAD